MFQAESFREGVRYFSLGQIVKNLTIWGVEALLSAFFLVLSCERSNNLDRGKHMRFPMMCKPWVDRDVDLRIALGNMGLIPIWEVRP